MEPAKGTIWKHVRTGHTYEVLCCASAEHDLSRVVIYQRAEPDAPTVIWSRWVVEFMDGRFEQVRNG